MKWTYSIAQKLKTALALAIVFVLVLTTNMINKKHFSELQQSFASVYEDRLLVENYIYKLSRELNNKRINLYDSADREARRKNKIANDTIQNLIVAYQQTKLTEAESKLFTAFIQEFSLLQELEKQYYYHHAKDSYNALEKQHRQMALTLSGLSDIQLEEGRNLIDHSNDIIATNNTYSRLEIILLICIGLVIQALIFASRSLRPNISQSQRLN